MLLYNTTFILRPAREREFLDFLRQTFLPALLTHPAVSELRLHQIEPHEGEEEMCSYALHYYVSSRAELDALYAERGQALHKQLADRFGEEVLGFSTLMRPVALAH